MNYGFNNSHGTYILALDAEHAVKQNILDDLLGHFKDRKVAAVASRQGFAIPKDDFNNDHLFYECMQVGKNHDGAAISCGSGVIYRRSALQEIGGFQEWNLVEDLYTTYVLNQHHYKVLYVNQSYSAGTAPYDLKGIYKQRGTWAQDTMRLFIWKSPLFARGLTLRQRMHYFEMGYSYLVSAFIIPTFYALNIYSLAANRVIINGGAWYVVARIPALYFTLKVYSKSPGLKISLIILVVVIVGAVGAAGYFYRKELGALFFKPKPTLTIPTTTISTVPTTTVQIPTTTPVVPSTSTK
jgi:cellulose synthase (UDP-forming)